MKIAVSVDQDQQISSHFGRSKTVHIYQINGSAIDFVETRMAPEGLQSHDFAFIADCEAVVSGSIGRPMQEQLMQEGIAPFISEETDPVAGIEAILIER